MILTRFYLVFTSKFSAELVHGKDFGEEAELKDS